MAEYDITVKVRVKTDPDADGASEDVDSETVADALRDYLADEAVTFEVGDAAVVHTVESAELVDFEEMSA